MAERHSIVTARGFALAYREAMIAFRKAMGYVYDASDYEVHVDLMAAMWLYEDARDWENDHVAPGSRTLYEHIKQAERDGLQLPDPRLVDDPATDSNPE